MSEPEPGNEPGPRDAFGQEVSEQAARKLRGIARGEQPIWLGLGMSGLIGWSVAVPTVLGGWLGWWLDRHHPGSRSWTLALLVAGLCIGCANAWHWVSIQEKAIRDDSEEKE